MNYRHRIWYILLAQTLLVFMAPESSLLCSQELSLFVCLFLGRHPPLGQDLLIYEVL